MRLVKAAAFCFSWQYGGFPTFSEGAPPLVLLQPSDDMYQLC